MATSRGERLQEGRGVLSKKRGKDRGKGEIRSINARMGKEHQVKTGPCGKKKTKRKGIQRKEKGWSEASLIWGGVLPQR